MGSGGGGQTSTVTHNSPPQLMNEGRQGYEQANEFYRSILESPPQYEGPRVAEMSPAQIAALEQQRGYFGGPQNYQLAGEQQVYNTASGNYFFQDPLGAPVRDNTLGLRDYNLGQDTYGLGGSNYGLSGNIAAPSIGGSSAQAYRANIRGAQSDFNVDPRFNWQELTPEEIDAQITAASAPILRDLERNVLPQIRDSSQLAGQGATSKRSDIAREKALSEYGEAVGQEVIAPLILQQNALRQDFDKAMQAYLQATAEGDANRATQAAIEMERISAQSHDNANQINATKAIAQGELSLRASEIGSRERIAGAQLQSGEKIASGELRSRERLGEAGLTSQERRDAAALLSGERTAFSNRAAATWDSERNRQLDAGTRGVGQSLQNEMYRIQALYNAGLIEQQQAQRMIDAAREEFEEPLYRQDNAARMLAQMAGIGPGSSQSIARQDTPDDTMGDVMQGLQMAMMVGSIVAKCSEKFKTNITELPDPNKIIDDILSLKIKAWRYKIDSNHQERIGPILEESPSWLRDNIDKDYLSLLSLVSGLVVTVQKQSEEIKELKNAICTN